MAITFDGLSKRIVLDTISVSASQLWSRWSEWWQIGDNSRWPIAMRQVGGEELGDGVFIPPYIFLLNNWRVRPMESNHNLNITGNLIVDGGGEPVVNTLGIFQVNVKYTVPVQAQAFSVSGGPTPTQVADAVRVELDPDLASIKANTKLIPALL